MVTSDRREVDARRLWYGGVMAGAVGAGVAVVGLLVVRGIFDVPVLVARDGELVDAGTWRYVGAALLAGAVATGLLHVLLSNAPTPYQFFAWIFGLAVAIAALAPFVMDAELATKVGTSAINLAIGLVIGPLVAGVGRSAELTVRAGWHHGPPGPSF